MVNGLRLATDMQRSVNDHRRAFAHHALVIRLIVMGFMLIVEQALGLHHVFADHVFATGREGLQIAVVAGLQNAGAVTHINGVRGAIDQRTHEFKLVAERALGFFALIDLAAHVRVPDQ